MRAIAPTALATTSPPRSATWRVPAASWLACCAFSAFFLTVAVISSIEAEVSSRLAACSSFVAKGRWCWWKSRPRRWTPRVSMP